jgi:hypothetical protein
VVVAVGSRFEEERCDSGKLIDVEAGPDVGWMRRSSTRWRVAAALELFGTCSRGGGLGRGRVGMAPRCTRGRA